MCLQCIFSNLNTRTAQHKVYKSSQLLTTVLYRATRKLKVEQSIEAESLFVVKSLVSFVVVASVSAKLSNTCVPHDPGFGCHDVGMNCAEVGLCQTPHGRIS
jgi:hypothetical protein